MYQGTTPALTFQIAGFDATGMTPFVSFKRGAEILTKTGNDIIIAFDKVKNASVIVVQMTQEETLSMRQGTAKVQMRFIDENGNAYATTKADLSVEDVIYKEVIKYDEDGGDEE